MKPLLTIGMATHDDFHGVYFTVQSLRLERLDVELVVVDNNPAGAHGQDVRGLLANVAAEADHLGLPMPKYVPMQDVQSTSLPRDRVFREASADAVLVMDCHVLLPHGTIGRLIDYWVARPESTDMVTGPLLHDRIGPLGDRRLLGTHYNDQWRAEMWGTWGATWSCDCDRPMLFSPLDKGDKQMHYVEVATQNPVIGCPHCKKVMPKCAWEGHEAVLVGAGYYPMATDMDDEMFEIPGMGLGLFSMRKAAWPGFHPDHRGFGGEELWIHEKVRRAGGRTWCLPWLQWLHRFGRPGGANYRLNPRDKARNYVLEFQQLDMPLDPIHDHFVADLQRLTADEWSKLIADPVGYGATSKGGRPATPDTAVDHNLDTLFDTVKAQPRDLDQHADKLRELAGQVDHVTTFCKRREWDVFLAAGRPNALRSHNQESNDPLIRTLHQVIERTETRPDADRRIREYATDNHDSLGIEIEETDLLVLDTEHTADRLDAELARHAERVRRWIVIRPTAAFGEHGECPGQQCAGLLPALRRFMRQNPRWSVIYHSAAQFGLTVLGCQKQDKPKPPGMITLASNFSKAMADHVADGFHRVSGDQLEARLEVCSICEQRTGDRCAVCGCGLSAKAALRSSDCPLLRWPELPPSVTETKAA